MSIPSGPKSPYLVQLFQVLLDPIDSLDRWSEEYGETFRLGGDKLPPTISFSSPDAIRTIFNAPSDTMGYSQKSELGVQPTYGYCWRIQKHTSGDR